MATNFTIEILPDDPLKTNLPSFDLKIKRSGLIFKDYTWSCLPGHIGATSGVADFIETSNLSLLILYKKEFSQFDDEGENPTYGILYGITPKFILDSTGWATIDFSGHSLQKRLKGKKNFLAILKEILKTKQENAHTNWHLINAY